ncbi:ATP-binding protein [Christiangramia sp. SM2212]|uniref:histidine kinase n=1 Tax=Christiangramia sediminicola TaxID=3073267 RepID=A0ABU1ELH6_9FLAO|nr:transporter substrate-binding domain-containing protein [Christiangramia sp. SM2212]MDR5589240.1 transporter substrate-binding domain-containing protein [Christiangramia sp. SM2212]
MKKYLILLVCIFCLFGLSSLQAQQNGRKKQELRVGIYENPPKIFTNEKGDADGIFVDIINYIAEKEHLKVRYIHKDWADLLTAASNGEIDIVPDVAYSKSRDSIFKFNSVPVISSWLEIYTTPNNKIGEVLELEGKRIGVLEGSVQEEYLRDDLKDELDIDYEILTFSTYPESIASLENSEIDVLLATRFFYFSELYDEKSIVATGIMLRPGNLYLAFSKNVDSNLIVLFDKNLSQLKNDSNSEYYKIIHDWFNRDVSSPFPVYLKYIILGLLLILILATVFTFLLRREVREKTKALEQRNAELLKAKEKAEESERLKTAFLQNMSHEIRTPMNGILGFMRLMRSENLDKDAQKKYIDIVSKSGKRLLTTINNILEFSKIRSKIVEVRIRLVNVEEVMNYHLQFFQTLAREKDVEFSIKEQITGAEALIESDRNILDGILTNLISNAIKFCKAGEVSFGNYQENDMLVFYVQDTGEGISEERIKAIFNPFVQGDQELSRAYEGSGLGLSIVKEYIDLIQGDIWVESEVGEGSTFYFSIPYKRMKRKKVVEEVQLPERLMNRNILVAEDDNISYLLISKYLKKSGLNSIRAKDGEEAVEIARNNPNIDLILMDIKMPKISGLDATKNIREFDKVIPIIAQTAFSKDGYRDIAINMGCNDYINKHIEEVRLLKVLKKYLTEL